MDEEQQVKLGCAADALLRSETFRTVVDYLGNSYANQFLLSKPHERMTREDAYNHHHALQDIVGVLNSLVQAKDAILEQRQEEARE